MQLCGAKSAKLLVGIRVGRVGKLLDSRRVDRVPRHNIVFAIVGFVVHVGSDHIFGLVLVAKVVLAKENARNRVNLAVVHIIFPQSF